MSQKINFRELLDKAVDNKTEVNWEEFLYICDYITSASTEQKECFNLIRKKLSSKDPHVVIMTLELLNCCVSNCGYGFQLIVCSREMVTTIEHILKNSDKKVISLLLKYLKKWAEDDFKGKSNLKLLPSLYQKLVNEGFETESLVENDDRSEYLNQQALREEEELKKAIQLSLDDKYNGSSSGATTSLYPSIGKSNVNDFILNESLSNTVSTDLKEPYKVRALYDFEAADKDEITFKNGEILLVLNDSDPNWWKGSNHRGQGLFPSNFVTKDLNEEKSCTSKADTEAHKNVQFNEKIKVNYVEEQVTKIDESKIDLLLDMLVNADQKDASTDPPELADLEVQCENMAPLIDKELEKIDRNHAALNSLSEKLKDALNLYAMLIKESQTAHGYNYNGMPAPAQLPVHNQMAQGPHSYYQPAYPMPYSQAGPPTAAYNSNFNYSTYDPNAVYPDQAQAYPPASASVVGQPASVVQQPPMPQTQNPVYYPSVNPSQPM